MQDVQGYMLEEKKKVLPTAVPAQSSATKLAVRNITFELTNACNLRCEFCTIWQERDKQMLPAKNILAFLTSPLFKHPLESITLTGGEAFIYPHLQKLFRALVALRLQKYLRTIAISSNGYSTEKILKFLRENKEYMKDVELFVSMDGMQPVHNKLRGRDDAYQKTMQTIEYVSAQFPEVKLHVKCTIQEENIDEILPIYRFCRERRVKVLFKLMEKSNASYYHRDYRLRVQPLLPERVSFNQEDKQRILAVLEQILHEEKTAKAPVVHFQYLSTIIEYLKGNFTIERCATPKHYLFVTSEGKIYPCLYQKAVNILSEGWEERFNDKEYIEMMNNALEGKCPGCLAYHGYLKYWNFKK